MSKKIDATLEFNGDLGQIIAMFQNEKYLAKKSEYASDYNFQVSTKNEVLEITLSRTFDLRNDVPSALRKLIGDELTLVQTDSWQKIDELKYHGTIELEVKSLKVNGKLQSSLTFKNGKTELSLVGEIKSAKAIVGGVIENEAAKYIDDVLQEEQDVANDWLENNR